VVSGKGADNETSSSQSSSQIIQTQAYYHINEDDIILTDDVLMCPFIFRSQDAVLSGALAECTMPGMLRAHFSPRNKLQNLEMVYDAMGFMQQLERAGGSEGECQIVPNSLEMALSPTTKEARVITLAKSPFLIVSVNEAWTRMTKYTQVEVEGKELLSILPEKQSGGASVAKKAPGHKFDEVTLGRCTSSVTLHYDKNGNEVVDYIRSYPLTK
jgi:PAS domain-containing protein